MDGVCSVCGEIKPVELTGSIRLRSAALNLEDKISIIYYATDDLIATNNDYVAERGVLLYKTAELLATKDPTKAYEIIVLKWSDKDNKYVGISEGIDARDMDKSQFAVAYLKLTDGTYVFGTREGTEHSVEYSPLIYCRNKKNDVLVGQLCRALMHYGAAAQVEQYKMTTGLMNEGFESIPYDETVLGESVFSVNTNVVNGMKVRSAALELKGAISYIIEFSVEDDEIADKQLYAEYSLLGETHCVELAPTTNGRLSATISGVPPKDMGATLRVKAYYLDENGEKVYGGELIYSGFAIDADSQASLTEFLQRGPADGLALGGMSDLLRGMKAMATHSKLLNVDLLAADESLMALDIRAFDQGGADPMALANWLSDREDEYDHVLIDCPPAFSAAAMAALIAADDVVIPLKLDAFGIRGLANIMEQIRNMRRVNPDLRIAGVLPTMYYPDEIQQKAEAELRRSLAAYDVPCFHHIRRTLKMDGSTFEQLPLLTYSPKSKTCWEYKIFVRDLLKGGEDDEL